jgi:hypothetical protein
MMLGVMRVVHQPREVVAIGGQQCPECEMVSPDPKIRSERRTDGPQQTRFRRIRNRHTRKHTNKQVREQDERLAAVEVGRTASGGTPIGAIAMTRAKAGWPPARILGAAQVAT